LDIKLLESHLLFSVEAIEFVLEELRHYSEAGSIEKEVELLVVFLSLGICGRNFGKFLLNNHFCLFSCGCGLRI